LKSFATNGGMRVIPGFDFRIEAQKLGIPRID
jgi:hypothetical protein